MSTAEHTPLVDTIGRLRELQPWFGVADLADPSIEAPPTVLAMRRLQDEQQGAIQEQFAMARSAIDHAMQAATRMTGAQSPIDVVMAQAGFGLAIAELAVAPMRAWLDMLPRLHECCVAPTNESSASSGASKEAEAGHIGTQTVPAGAREAKPSSQRVE